MKDLVLSDVVVGVLLAIGILVGIAIGTQVPAWIGTTDAGKIAPKPGVY